MKKIAALFLFGLLSLIGFGQEEQLEYTVVVPVANTTAKELHDRYMDWFTGYFNNADRILIESADDTIVANPFLLYYPNFDRGSDGIKGKITYTLEVDFSDGSFTYVINNFVHHGNPKAVHGGLSFGLITKAALCPLKFPNQIWVERAWNDIKYQIKKQIVPLTENLQMEMSKGAEKKIMDSQP